MIRIALAMIGLFVNVEFALGQNLVSIAELRQSTISDYNFYRIYIRSRGYESFDRQALGSWEFADRIENLVPTWIPYHQFETVGPQVREEIERAKAAAAHARSISQVDYPGTELAFDTDELWREYALLPFERLKGGDALILDSLDLSFRSLLLGAIKASGAKLRYQVTREPYWSVDIEGPLTSSAFGSQRTLFLTVQAERILQFRSETGSTVHPGQNFSMMTDAKVSLVSARRLTDSRKLSKVLRLDLFTRLLRGERVPSPFLSSEESVVARQIYADAGFILEEQDGLFSLQSLPALLERLRFPRGRERGVRPCEANLVN